MKKTTLLLLSLISTGIAMAQGVEIYLAGTTDDISGTTHSVLCAGNETTVDFEVKNMTGIDQFLNIRRSIVMPIAGTADKLCWGPTSGLGGACYDYSVLEGVPVFTTMNDPDINDGENGILNAYHKGNGYAGTVVYRYVVLDATGADIDSIDLEFVSFASVDQSSPAQLNVVPDPINRVIYLNGVSESCDMVVYDFSGKSIWTTRVSNSGVAYPEGLVSGLYFYRLFNDAGETTGKFVW